MRLKFFVLGLLLFCCVLCARGQLATAVRLDSALLLAKDKADLLTFYQPSKVKVDSFFDAWRSQFAALQYSSVVGGVASSPVVLQSNKVYRGLTIDLRNTSVNGITGNGVSNVRITHCRIINTKGFAILLNGCSNVNIDSCFISNVGFGVYAQSGSKAIKVNYNQILNVNGIDASFLGHAIQFNGVNGGGSQINYNRIENIKGVALHPHDQLGLYKCNGLKDDPIQVVGNWVRGGQIDAWPSDGFTGCGIAVGDVSGSFQLCRDNIIVNSGIAGIQCIGSVSSITIDRNLIFNDAVNSVASQGITVLGSVSNVVISNNRVLWKNKRGFTVALKDGETGYYLGNSNGFLPGVTMINNVWLDTSLSGSILPAVIIALK